MVEFQQSSPGKTKKAKAIKQSQQKVLEMQGKLQKEIDAKKVKKGQELSINNNIKPLPQDELANLMQDKNPQQSDFMQLLDKE